MGYAILVGSLAATPTTVRGRLVLLHARLQERPGRLQMRAISTSGRHVPWRIPGIPLESPSNLRVPSVDSRRSAAAGLRHSDRGLLPRAWNGRMKDMPCSRPLKGLGHSTALVRSTPSNTGWLSRMSRCPEKTDSRDFICPEKRLFKNPEI